MTDYKARLEFALRCLRQLDDLSLFEKSEVLAVMYLLLNQDDARTKRLPPVHDE